MGRVSPSSPVVACPLSKPPSGFGRHGLASRRVTSHPSIRAVAASPVLEPKRIRSTMPERNQTSPSA